MKVLFIIIFVFIALILIIILTVFALKTKFQKLYESFSKIFLFNDILENNDFNEIPKSLSSMDSLYLEKIKKDFPNLNINLLKRDSEGIIIETLNAIQKKDEKVLLSSQKINSYIKSKIDDLKDKNVIYDKIKIHKTVVTSYTKSGAVATIVLASSLEYFYKEGFEVEKKIQTRYKCEYIYIIDSTKVGNAKALGLNCPNCGAPIKSLGHKRCDYCGTGVIDIVKKNWIINDIKEY